MKFWIERLQLLCFVNIVSYVSVEGIIFSKPAAKDQYFKNKSKNDDDEMKQMRIQPFFEDNDTNNCSLDEN